MKGLRNFSSTRHVLVIDALRYSLVLERKAYSVFSRAIRTIEKQDDGKGHPKESHALLAIGSAWEIIDIVQRARGLLTQVSGLPQKSPEVQLFLRNTARAEDFRNLYQHLNTALAKLKGATNPVMGAVSWVTKNPNHSITIFVGTGTPDVQVHTVAFDNRELRFAQQLLFSAGNKDIELDKLHLSTQRLFRFLNEWLRSEDHLSQDAMKVGVVRFQIKYAV